MTVNSKMTALADEIRELSGTNTSKSIDAMTSDIDAANTEISEQMELIAQISTALENKAAGGGGVELPELTNPASTSDILSGKEAIDGEGSKITGTIATRTSSNLTANGATVTVPAGYYASDATKSVATTTRAETTISVTKDDTNDKLTLTASNNQSTGYVIGANKTATKTVTLTTSGATATMSDGTNSVSKSVATGSAKTPATTVTKNPTISVSSSGLITASVSGTQNVTPTVTAGYVSSGTAGTITVSGSATKQLTIQGAKTITPSTSSQTVVAKDVYTTGVVTVGPIPSNYEDVGTETTEYTSLNAELEEVINSLPEAGGGSSGKTSLAKFAEGVLSVITADDLRGATSIGSLGFYSCLNITSVEIPDSVTIIDDSAFLDCSNLTSIVIPNSVTSIGEDTFLGCLSLTNIAFSGTTEQWNAIVKYTDWNLNVPATYVQCSDGQVAI